METLSKSGFYFFKRLDTSHIITEHWYTGLRLIYDEEGDTYTADEPVL